MNSRAASAPIPLAAPVITQTLPSSRPGRSMLASYQRPETEPRIDGSGPGQPERSAEPRHALRVFPSAIAAAAQLVA